MQLLRTAETVGSSSRKFFDRWDLSPAQFNLLNLLFESSEGMTQSELGRELLTHRSNITGLVDRLEERGWVLRQTQTGDRRAWRVVLTSEGRMKVEEVLPAYYRAAEILWQGVGVRQAEEVSRILKTVTENTEKAARNLAQGLS